MSENLQKLLKEALLNNSYDYDSVHNTLKKTWMNSFSYLYSLQKAYIEYEELFYISNDDDSRNSKLIGHIYLDKLLRANFDIDYDLIHVYNRDEFRLSKFYLNEINFMDMIYNPEIFLKTLIVIIDDKVIWDYKVKITKDCTNIILPFKQNFVISNERNSETDEIIYLDHKIQVLVIDNIFYQRYEMNKNNLYFDKNSKTIKISKTKMKKLTEKNVSKDVTSELLAEWNTKSLSDMTETQSVERLKLYNKRMKYLEVPHQDGIMMCSIHFPNKNNRQYELGTILIPMEDDGNGNYIANLTDDLVDKLSKHNLNIYISMCHINRLYHHKFYTGLTKTKATSFGADLLVVQDKEMVPYKTPVPVENFMIFKKSHNSNGYILEKNTDMLEMYYPNIYRIKDESLSNGDEYDIYYFYYNAYDLKYTVLFDFYYTFLVNKFPNQPIEKIINDIYYNRSNLSGYTSEEKNKFTEIFKKIINYQYHNYQYAETDFLYRYLQIPENKDKEPIEYKDETLKEWIHVDPWLLRDYVLDQNKLGTSYHLFTNTLNLKSRIRYNTELEIGTVSKEFDEPRYVFSFNNEKEYPLLLNCRVFVDGIMIGDVYQERHLFMDYFYVPTNLVTEDSYIELEIFPEYEFNQEFIFTSMTDEKEITLAEPDDIIFPTISDVYFETTDKSARFDKKYFDITNHYSRGDIKVESNDSKKPVKFTRLSSFKIKPNHEDVLNIPMVFKITKMPRNVRFMIDTPGFVYIELVEKGFAYNVDFLRIFRNGRLLPRSKYKLITTFNHPRLLFLEWFDIGDIIYIDITPYRYTEIYYQEELSKDTTLIDLRSIINKPFDIRYYDVYINGRKLSLNNVFSITPWQLTLVNLKSNYNLVIYERERDWEYFGLDYTQNIYYYSLDDLFKSGIVSDSIKNKMIKDIIDSKKDPRLNIYPNTNEETALDFEEDNISGVTFHIFYYDELLPKTFINPDILQENEEIMIDNYKEIFDIYKKTSYQDSMTDFERERRKDYPSVICLDPDIYCRIEGSKGDSLLVYEVGHMDDNINEEYLSQKIIIPTEGNIDKS